MKKKRKKSPEFVQWEAEADERLRKLRELVDRGWQELGVAAPSDADENHARLRELIARGQAALEDRRRAAESGT